MSYKLIKPYSEKERIDFIIKHNHQQGLTIEETNDALFALEINEIMNENNIPIINPNYENEVLQSLKKQKLQDLTNALTNKQNNTEATLTFNIPVMLKKGEEEKYVENFKLLTVTSAGSLTNVLMGYALVASTTNIADIIVTDDGYTIVGLNEVVGNTKLINLIFAECTNLTAQITIYFRDIKEQILNAETREELENIEVNFEQF